MKQKLFAALAALTITTQAHAAPYCLQTPPQVLIYSAKNNFIAGGTFAGTARCTRWAPMFMRYSGGKLCQGWFIYGWNYGHPFSCQMVTLRRNG